MNLLDSLAVGLRALSVNKTRSLLTVLGIIIGVAAVVCMVSVGSGAREEVSEKIRTLGANLVVIRPGAQLSGAARLETGTRQTLTEDDALALRRELTNVQAVAPTLSRPMQVVAGNNNWATSVDGIDNDYLVAREWRIGNGRTFTLDELGSGTKVAIIGVDVGEALFPGVPAVGQTFRIGNVPFTVIGTLERKGQGAAGRSQDDIVFIPLSAAKSRVLGAVPGPSREAMDLILIKASDQLAIPQVKTDITSLLRARHHLRPDAAEDFSIENPADVLTVLRLTPPIWTLLSLRGTASTPDSSSLLVALRAAFSSFDKTADMRSDQAFDLIAAASGVLALVALAYLAFLLVGGMF